ncbi:MAG: hypothetical protein QOJ59_1264 [Thermomicrobiales bacterium]|jgi:uncharacterized membrane protein YeaQ/YmgE (transglycosylase-associated protein family)|nr:hypothetical protein [Thermomicrobiales bacterium]
MGDIIVWLIIGLMAGGVASFVVPGRTPGGVLGAVIIGILGGVFGGWIIDALDAGENLAWAGALGVAAVGAVVLLLAMRSVDRATRI